MKHTAARLTAAVLLAGTMITTPAFALTGTVNDNGVRLREEASTSSTVLKSLSNGTNVEIMDTLTDWYKVSYNGKTGFIASDYVTIKDDSTYVQVADGPLNIREKPTTDSKKVGSLGNGKVVKILKLIEAKSDGEIAWYQTEDGYIAAEYVVPCDDPDRKGSAAYVKVEEGPLNIRSEPDTKSEKVGTVAAGKIIEVNGMTDGWYKIGEGYISADYVVQSSADEAKAQEKKASESKSQSSSSSDSQSNKSTTSSVPAPQGSGAGQDIANYALQFVGYPYVYGGSSPKGFDCSGFTSYVYKQFGYGISRTASGQLDNGSSVSRGQLQPGDLVMFKKGGSSKRASHVGIYIGGNQFVHASTSKTGVIISSMDSSYYATGFVGARRLAG